MVTKPAALKFGDVIDLLLARLADLERDMPSGALIDLHLVARELTVDVPDQWVFDAAKVLESRGWAQVLFTIGGGCRARLTGEGRLYVEEERGTGIIGDYHRQPGQFVSAPTTRGAGVSTRMSIEEERAPAFRMLRSIEEALARDSTLTQAERDDLLADVRMAEQQMRKHEPNRAALAALLEPVARIASVGGFVADLVRLLNP